VTQQDQGRHAAGERDGHRRMHQGAADPLALDGGVHGDGPDGGHGRDGRTGLVLDRARRQQQVAHEGAVGVHGDEREPAVGRLVPDAVDDVGLLGPGKGRELDGTDRRDVAGRLEADRDGARLAAAVAPGRQLATAVRRDSGIGRETGTGWI